VSTLFYEAFSLANTMACSHRAVTTLGPSAGGKKWCENGSMLGMASSCMGLDIP